MPVMQFKGEFAEAIRRGEKVTTLRRWPSCRISSGDRVYAQRIGWLRIISAALVDLKSLCLADAVSDGFASLEDLFATLQEIYPNHESDGRNWYRIEFKVDGLLPEKSDLAKKESPKLVKRPKSSIAPLNLKSEPPHGRFRNRLARKLRAELDKAVQNKGSLFPI